MSLIIFGRTLPQNKKIIYALTELYGIGLPSSLFICRDLGFLPSLKVKDLTDIQQYQLAKKIKNEFGLSTLKNMLPTGGTGTLKNLLVADSGFVFAKTGSFNNNYNISGLLVTKKNKPLLFSIMVNHYIGNSKVLRKKIEIFIHQIRENN